MADKALDIHLQAEKIREEGKFLESLILLDQAVLLYQQEKDYKGMSSALQSRALAYKHLFWETADIAFAYLTQKNAETSLQIAEHYNLTQRIGSCYYSIAQAAMLTKEYTKAIEFYLLALKHYEGSQSGKGDYQYHLGVALYLAGDAKKGKETIFAGIAEIEAGKQQVDDFFINVWLSGAYLRLARLLASEDKDQAREYYKKAEAIITQDYRLILRKRQLQKIKHIFQ